MSSMVSRPWFPFLALALGFAASCDPARVSSPGNAGTSGGGAGAPGGGGPGGGGPGGGGGSSFVLPDAAAGGAMDAAATNQRCAEEAHQAEIVPVDLMLLLDASGSMTESAGMGNKWEAAQSALSAFVRDPRSAGLGAGLQFYPGGRERSCMTDMDCGAMSTGSFYCRPRQACIGPGGLIGASACGGPNGGTCTAGTTCTNIGRCATSGADCDKHRPGVPGGRGHV